MWSEPELVIFDCDGVLVDSEVISNRVLAGRLTAEGLPTTVAEARRDYQGLLLAEMLAEAQAQLGRTLPEEWVTAFERERAQAFRRELRPVAGVVDAVQRIEGAGIAVCVASQGKLEKTRLSLALTGLDGLFAESARFSAESVSRGKPAPELFLYAAEAMQAQPAGCVVVEDTPSGVVAAVS
ncbi:MAG: hydrolase, partial [Solirubrobacterales bacterium]|nr:hydrolase [Solirubrobacterales bacterium]